MTEACEPIERAGFTARIIYDESPSSPDDWDTLGTLAFDTRGASLNVEDLPSDHYGNGRFVDDCPACEGSGEAQTDADLPRGACSVCDGYGYVTDGEAICKRTCGASHVLPVRAWDDRNGTELRIADSWDEANGWIYATPESVAMTGVPEERLETALREDLQAWQQWAHGDVYGVEVTDQRGEVVDSCWGFYGLEYAQEEARAMLETDVVLALEANPALAGLVVN